MSIADPEILTSISGASAKGVSPDLLKTASSMISKMPPENLQRMLQIASSFNQNLSYSSNSASNPFGPGFVPPKMSPEMHNTTSDMISKMPPKEVSKMFDMASGLQGRGSTETSMNSGGFGSERGNLSRESSSSSSSVPQSNLINPNMNMQEQMRSQMIDPALREIRSLESAQTF